MDRLRRGSYQVLTYEARKLKGPDYKGDEHLPKIRKCEHAITPVISILSISW